MTDPGRQEDGPPPVIRLFARGSSAVIARAPLLWPLLRRPTERFWQRAAAGWDERIGLGSAERLAPLAAACDLVEPPPRAILELGTGTGPGAVLLARRFPAATVTGVDLSSEMVDRARARLPEDVRDRVSFAVADAASLPFDDGSFQLVCQLNLPLFAATIARMTAPGGHVIVASSLGSRTPYHTPERVARRVLANRGVEVVDAGRAGAGTYLLGRRR